MDGMISLISSFSYAPGIFVIHCNGGPVLWDWEEDLWIQLKFDGTIHNVRKFA
jgi:hypothetical protein